VVSQTFTSFFPIVLLNVPSLACGDPTSSDNSRGLAARGGVIFSFFGQVSNRKVRTVQYSCVPGTPKIWTLVTVFARRLVPPKVQDSAHLSGNCKAGLSLPAHAEVYLTRVCRRPRGAGWGVLFYPTSFRISISGSHLTSTPSRRISG
jgi:hypothetical protein